MGLRELHKLISVSQNKLIQNQSHEYTLEQVAMLYGIYKSKGGKGVVKGFTPEQVVIASATEFYINETQRKLSDTKTRIAIVEDLCERLRLHAQNIGVDANYKLNVRSNNRLSLRLYLVNDVRCAFKTGKELAEPYSIELSLGLNTFKSDHIMVIEDMFVGLMGVKGCAFANTYKIVEMLSLLKKVY